MIPIILLTFTSVEGGNVAMTNSAAPGAERISAYSEQKKEENKSINNRFNAGGYNGFGGGGVPFQLPMLPQLQYNQNVGNHTCCRGNNSNVTEIDSSKFLLAIVGKSSILVCGLRSEV